MRGAAGKGTSARSASQGWAGAVVRGKGLRRSVFTGLRVAEQVGQLLAGTAIPCPLRGALDRARRQAGRVIQARPVVRVIHPRLKDLEARGQVVVVHLSLPRDRCSRSYSR